MVAHAAAATAAATAAGSGGSGSGVNNRTADAAAAIDRAMQHKQVALVLTRSVRVVVLSGAAFTFLRLGFQIRDLFRKAFITIDRDAVVDSSATAIGRLADADMPDAEHMMVTFKGDEGVDAGGLTDDWLSLFMQEAMSPFRNPPLFLLIRQDDATREAVCLRLNHSMHAFGVDADAQRALMRTFGFVLAACLKRGRFACNKYMLSRALLLQLLGQELPPGLLGLAEEFPEEYEVCLHASVDLSFICLCLSVSFSRVQTLERLRNNPNWLELAEMKYTACSRMSDFRSLQNYLGDCIEHMQRALGGQQAARLDSSKLTALQSSIAQHGRLKASLQAAADNLEKQRQERISQSAEPVEALDDTTQSVVRDVAPDTRVAPPIFDAYCADVVQKRLRDDVEKPLQWMQQGFWCAFGGLEALQRRGLKASDVQKTLFPREAVTVELFKANSECMFRSANEKGRDTANIELFWKVMQEDLNQEQVQNVFYFVTNWHTVSGAPRKVRISFEVRERQNDVAPHAHTCMWSLDMPDCLAPGDTSGNSSVSRKRMREGAAIAALSLAVIIPVSHAVRSIAYCRKC